MYPWKIAFRFVSAMVLFATGGYAAGADLPLPFDVAPTEVAAPAAPAPEAPTEPTAPAAPDIVDVPDTAAPDTAAPDAGAGDDGSTDDSTTDTTAPGSAAPDIVDPGTDPAPAPPLVEVPAKPVTPPTSAPPTAAPVDPEAPEVCAAAATSTCGVDPAADNSFDARVARCRAWWTALADGLDQRGRPQMAAGARRVADRCDEMIARWQQWQEKRQQRDDRRDERRDDRRVKGDHNNDGRPDNGWQNKDRDRDGRGDDNRAVKASKVNKASRHSEGRR